MPRLVPLLILLTVTGLGAGADFERELAPLMARLPERARASVAVAAVEDGTPAFVFAGDTALPIASLTKLFVSSAALVGLGADYRFHTRVVALGPISDGSVPGLGIIGGGDPCLDEHFTQKDPDRIFTAWAERLKAAGITRITGDLVIDTRWFSGPIRPETYPQDQANQQSWFSAPASAFAWNDNCIEVRARPGDPDDPAIVEVRPRSARIVVTNRSRSVTGGKPKGISVSRAATANQVVVTGDYNTVTAWFPLAIQRDPDLLAGDHCRAILGDRGITVAGTVVLGEVAVDPASILIDETHTLLPALTILNQRSQNFYGEQILRVLGRERLKEGSVPAGCRAVREVLTGLDLDPAGCEIIDGSGLSHGNRASALAICGLLARMHRHPLGAAWRDTLKDEDGAPGAKVKTGSHATARCLAGYVEGKAGRRWAFAIILNRGGDRSLDWAPALRDNLFAAIARVAAGG